MGALWSHLFWRRWNAKKRHPRKQISMYQGFMARNVEWLLWPNMERVSAIRKVRGRPADRCVRRHPANRSVHCNCSICGTLTSHNMKQTGSPCNAHGFRALTLYVSHDAELSTLDLMQFTTSQIIWHSGFSWHSPIIVLIFRWSNDSALCVFRSKSNIHDFILCVWFRDLPNHVVTLILYSSDGPERYGSLHATFKIQKQYVHSKQNVWVRQKKPSPLR